MERGSPFRPAGDVRIERVAQPVVVRVRLTRQAGREPRIAIDLAEPPGAIRPDVDARIAGRDPARHRPADPAAAPEPVERQARGDPEPADTGEWPQQRIGVGRHRIGVADEADRLGVGEEREAADGTGHQRREPFPIGWQRARGVVPRHAVLPARDRVGLVAAEDHATLLALAVHEVVGVAEAGHVAGQLVARDRFERDVLVVDRRRRDEGADHRGHLGRPHPGRVDDDLGRDRAVLGQDGRDLAPGRQLDAGHAHARPDADAEGSGGIGDGVGGAVRIEVPVAGEMDGPVQGIG